MRPIPAFTWPRDPHLNVPVPVGETKPLGRDGYGAAIHATYLLFGLARPSFVVAIVAWFIAHAGTLTGRDFRVGVLAAAALFVIRLLTLTWQQAPIVDALIALRRRLILERGIESDVANELELLLLGASTTHLVSAAVTPLLDAMRDVRESFANLSTDLGHATAFLQKQNSGTKLSDEEERALDAVLHRILARHKAHADMVETQIDPLERKFRAAAVAARLAGEDATVAEMRQRVDDAMELIKVERAKQAEAVQALRALVPKAERRNT